METDDPLAGHRPLSVFPVHSRSAQPPWDGWSPILPRLCPGLHLDTWAHLARLRDVFAAHRQGGIRLKPAKTKLFREQVDYLGHTLSQDGITMQEAYIARILDWTAPPDAERPAGLLRPLPGVHPGVRRLDMGDEPAEDGP